MIEYDRTLLPTISKLSMFHVFFLFHGFLRSKNARGQHLTSHEPPRFSWLVWSLFRHHVASGSLRPWCCFATWTIIAMGPWVDGYYRIWHEGKVWEDMGDTMNIGDIMGLTCRNTVLCLFCWILIWQINMAEPCGTRTLRNTETHWLK